MFFCFSILCTIGQSRMLIQLAKLHKVVSCNGNPKELQPLLSFFIRLFAVIELRRIDWSKSFWRIES